MSATVVVCTRGRVESLETCLRALSRLQYPDYDVLVVENGADGESTRTLCERYGVRYLHSPVIGLSRARNDGARACTSELVAYTDDDALPHKNWLTNLASEFSDPSVMVVSGPQTPFDDETLRLHGSGATPCIDDQLPRVVDRNTPGWFALTNFGGVGNGANMCFRRTAFEVWPGFDERLGRGAPLNSAEEHLAIYQLALLGYRSVYTTRAIVWHPWPDDPDVRRRIHYENLSNAVTYACLLWSEFPESRIPLLKHLWSRSFGARSRQRAAHGNTTDSARVQLRVIVDGIRRFWRLPKAGQRKALLSNVQMQEASR